MPPRPAETDSEPSRNKFLGANTLMHWDNVGNVKNRSNKNHAAAILGDDGKDPGWPYIRIQFRELYPDGQAYHKQLLPREGLL